MKSTQYSEKTLEHFRNPRNVGHARGPQRGSWAAWATRSAATSWTSTSRSTDDRIKDIKFQTFGCGSAVATSSMITELVWA